MTESAALLPPVTVIVVSYNHFAFLPTLLESIEAQTVRPDLTILCDDASTDGSPRLLADFAAKTPLRTHLQLNADNRGLTPTLNAALAHVRTPYFAYISGDDYMFREHLASQLARLVDEPELAFVYSDAIRVDSAGTVLDSTFFESMGRSAGDVDDFRSLLQRNWIPAASVVASTAAVRAAGGYDESLFFEDYDLWLRLASSRPFSGAAEPSVAFREVAGSLGHTRFRDDDLGWQWAKVRIRGKLLGRDPLTDRTIARMMLPVLVTLAAAGAARDDLSPYLAKVFRADPRPVTGLYLAASHVPGGLLRAAARRRRSHLA